MKLLALFFLVLPSFTLVFGQVDSIQKRIINAQYIEQKPKIDGILDEDVWKNAPVASQFTELSPVPFSKPTERTEVKVLYTTEGIYVGVMLYDAAPDSILKQLSVRDITWNVNADNFKIYIDALLTQQSSFVFTVSAAGVQIDENNGDKAWDAVWKSEVKIIENGWVVEVEIPYSQLRFPKSAEQTWGINFSRSKRRTREEYFWAPIDPTLDNQVQQYGLLKGIEKVKPPVRLSMTPYLAGYLNYNYDKANKELR